MPQLTKAKARKILRHGEVKGKELTPRQRKFMGHISGGGKGRKVKKK